MFFRSEHRRRQRDAAHSLYMHAVTAARRPELYESYGVPDTLDGRFEMVALHLFPLVHRLLPAAADPELARLVSEAFVNDMDAAFREMGVGDLSVPKRMKTLYSAFAGRVDAYTKALVEGEGALAAAVERNVYPDGDPGACALRMARYLESLVAAVRAADLDSLREGRLDLPAPAASNRSAS